MCVCIRLPTFGIYVQMFTTVAKNFAKFLAAYFCLLVAFALSFCVLFPNYQSFNVYPPAAVVKTLVMMAGEIEYENFIYENGDALFNFTGNCIYPTSVAPRIHTYNSFTFTQVVCSR